MTPEKFARVLGDVDEKYILEAVPKKRKPMWQTVLPMAAAVVLLIAAGSVYAAMNFGRMGAKNAEMAYSNDLALLDGATWAAETTAAAALETTLKAAQSVADGTVPQTLAQMENAGEALVEYGNVEENADSGTVEGFSGCPAPETAGEELSGCGALDELAEGVLYTVSTANGITSCYFNFCEFTEGEILTFTVDDSGRVITTTVGAMELLECTDNMYKFRSQWDGTPESLMPELKLEVEASETFRVRGVFTGADGGKTVSEDFNVDIMTE